MKPGEALDLLARIGATIADETVDAVDNILSIRYLGQRVEPGSRIDITCETCKQRLVLSPHSVALIDRGAKPYCLDCVQKLESAKGKGN